MKENIILMRGKPGYPEWTSKGIASSQYALMMLSGTAAWDSARVEPRGSQLPADPLQRDPPASHVQFPSKPLKGIP